MKTSKIISKILAGLGVALVGSVMLWWISLIHISVMLFVVGILLIALATNMD